MAKGKKTGGRDFTKGNCAAVSVPKNIHFSIPNTKGNVKEMYSLLHELCTIPDGNGITGLRILLEAVKKKGIEEGDWKTAEFFLNRIYGKIPDADSDAERTLVKKILNKINGDQETIGLNE